MGKKRSPVFKIEDALKSMGVPDIGNSQTVKALNQERAEQQAAKAYTPNVLQDPYQTLKYDKEVYGDLLNPGQYSLDPTGMDDAVSENQGMFSRIKNGILRLGPLIGTKFLSQTASLAHAIDSTAGWEYEDMMTYDKLSDRLKGYEEMENTIKNEWLPIYEKSNYQDRPLIEQLGTSQFWLDTVGDGVAFVSSMAIGTKGLGNAAGALGKAFSWVPASERVLKLGQMATTTGIAGANAAMTASMQAEQAYRQTFDELQRVVNPNTGLNYTPEEAKEKAAKAASDTFNGTFWVHTIPALWETRTILALGKPLEGAVGTQARKKLMDQISSGKLTLDQVYKNPSKYLAQNAFKTGLKRAATGAIIEGPYEENIENAVVSTSVNNAINDTSGNLKDTLISYLDNMLGNFKDKGSLTEMIVGSIIGGGMGMVSGTAEGRAYNQAVKGYVDGMQAADNLYLENVNAPFKRYTADGVTEAGVEVKKGDLMLDASGEPMIDLRALTKLSKQVIADQNLSDSSFNAVLTNNPQTLWMNENLSLSSAVFSEMARAEQFGDTPEGAMDLLALRLEKRIDEIQAMEKSETIAEDELEEGQTDQLTPSPEVAKANALIAQRKNNIRNRISQLKDAYVDANKRVSRLERVNPSEDYKNFLDVTKKALFYEATKRLSYDGIVSDLNEQLNDELSNPEEIAAKIKAIQEQRNASLEASREMVNNVEQSYARWDAYNNFLDVNNERKSRLENKAGLSTEEKEELNLANFNIGMSLYKSGTFADFSDPRQTIEPAIRRVEETGRRTEVYENIGKEILENDKLDTSLTEQNYDAALNHLSKISEKNTEAIGKIEDLLRQKDKEIDVVDNEITDILNNDEDIEEFNPATFTPELQEKFDQFDKLKIDRQKLESLQQMAKEKNGRRFSKMTPAQVEEALTEEYLDKLHEKARHVENVALEDSGDVKEEFVDVPSVDRAIKDVETALAGMRDLDSEAYGNAVFDSERLLERLKSIRESAILNQNNRLGKQKAIADARANLLLDTVSTDGIVPIFDSVLGDNAKVRISQVKALKDNRLEGILALISYVKEKGKKAQIKKAARDLRNSAKESFKEILSNGTKNFSPILKQFKKNPSSSLMQAWLKMNYEQQGELGLIDISKGSPYSKFEATRDYDQLLNLIETTPENVLGVDKDTLRALTENAKIADGAIKLGILLDSPSDIIEQMIDTADEVNFVPTPQQEIAVREMVSWFNSKKSESPYGNWGYLRGVAGTGKTGITLNWALRLSGIPAGDILGTARVQNAADVLSDSIGSKAVVFDDLDVNTIEDNVNLIVIDEYATIDTQRLRAFENEIRLLNQTREHKISVLLLGDPTQITPNGSVEFDLTEVRADNTESHQTENIQHFTPLTVVYRSDISGVNEVSDYFQGNNKEVTSVSARSSAPIESPLAIGSHITSSPGTIEETITRNQNEENEKGIKPRSRAIIVGTQAQIDRYSHIPNTDVLWVVDAQSKTYDEVYVDINPLDYPNIPMRNTAMYTAVSRAKQYAQLVYKGTNTNDSSLLSELNKNLGDLQLAKDEFIDRKTAEKKFLEDLQNGRPLKSEKADKAPEAETKIAPTPKVVSTEVQELVETDDEQEVETTQEDSIYTSEEGNSMENEIDTREEVEDPAFLTPENEIPVADTQSSYGSEINELNVDSEVYTAMRNKSITVDAPLVYMMDESGNIISIAFSQKENRWIKAGMYNMDNPEYIPLPIKEAMIGKKKSPKGFLKEINRPGNVWTPENLSTHPSFIKSGFVSSLEPMMFSYSPDQTRKADTNIVDWIKQGFSGFFGKSPSQVARESKISFRIFSASELARDGYINSPYAANLKPGLPYAIVGGNLGATGFEHAFFVPLQPKGLQQESSQVQILSQFRDDVAVFEGITKQNLGTSGFSEIIKTLKSGLEVRMVTDAFGTRSPQVFVKENFGYDQYIESLEKRNSTTNIIKDPLDKLSEEDKQSAIRQGLKIASQIYGYKKAPALYTEEQVNELNKDVETGGEYERVEASREFDVDGSVYYLYNVYKKTDAQGKNPKSVYKMAYSLDSSKGPAQIALNQIAKSNEFVGGTRIRTIQYTAGKGSRRQTGTGKSLLSTSGGGTRLQGMLNLLRAHLDDFGLTDPNFSDEQVMKNFKKLVKEQSTDESNDYSIFRDSIANMINEIEDPALQQELENKFREVENRKETLPITLQTLDKIVSPENFENGRHRMSESTPYTDQKGQQTTGRTYLRTPLNREAFNSLGSDPEANKDALESLVSTQFQGAIQTRLQVGGLQNEPSAAPATPNIQPTVEEGNNSATSNLQSELDEVNSKLQDKSLSPEDKKALIKRKIELTKQLNSRAYDTNAGRPAEGKDKITIDAAKKLFKKLVPGAVEEELLFLSKAVLDKFAKPNENLLGLYQNGRIAISTYGNTVSERVLRHEIFHKIYAEYLTEAERKVINDAISDGRTLSAIEIEEQLADLFMGYANGSPNWYSPWFKKLFNKIKKWFGLIDNNEYEINKVFNSILAGDYWKQTDPFPRGRRAYSDISNFGNVANYKEALALVRGVVYRDLVKSDNLAITPLTLGEAYNHVSSSLQERLKSNLLEIHSNEEILSTLDSTEDAELVEELEALNSELLETNALLEHLFPKKRNSDQRTAKVFRELWKDLYPNYEFQTKTKIFDSEKEEYVDIDEMSIEELEELQLSGLRNFTLQSDTVNQESKTTEKVKNFLSFIYNEKNANKPVNFRRAYYESLRAIKELIPSEGDFETQIRYQAEENGIDLNSNSDSAAVISSILDLLHNATTEVMTTMIDGTPVALELNQRYNFLDENTYVDSQGKTVNRLSGQSTSSFLNQLLHREQVTNMEDIDPEVLKRTLNASFRQVVARETARELFSAMLSQTEHNFMIGEKQNVYNFDQGRVVTQRKYMSAQLSGEERGTTADIKNAIIDRWAQINENDWKKYETAKTPKEKLSVFFKNVLRMPGVSEVNSAKAKNTIAAIDGFRQVVQTATKDGVKTIVDQDSGEEILQDARYFLADEGKLLNQLTYAITRDNSASRPTTLKDTQGKSRYNFSNGSQAREMLNRVIRFIKNDGFYNAFAGKDINEKKINSLPVHLRNSWGNKNIFVNGLNSIYEIKDHDGIRTKNRSEFGIGYSDETDKDFLERNFLFGFLQYLAKNTAEGESPKYVQYFYTISNRPRMIGAEVNVLNDSQINSAFELMMDQIIFQPDINNVKNYDPSKMVNASELKASMEQVLGKFDKAKWKQYHEGTLNISLEEKNRIIQLTKAKLRQKAEAFLNKLEFENLAESAFDTGGISVLKNRKSIPQVNYNANSGVYLDEDGNEIELAGRQDYFERDDFKAAYSFILNNYVNSYFLNQIPVGNYNFFKDANDLVKRMSGVFAPGAKGLAMENGAFMRPQFKLAVMSDPKLLKEDISEIFGDTKLKEWSGDETDIADAQGFMTPARAREVELGYGKAYKAGAVLKPAFYGQTTIKDANGNNVQVPVMVKYSSVVLTDELVNRFPKLRALRDSMTSKNIDELVFDSANKVGVPVVNDENGKNLRKMPSPNADLQEIIIPDGAIYNLDNENFRLQMNPASHSYGNISFMTQLAYFMNTGHKFNPNKDTQAKNEQNAANIYEAFGKLVELGVNKVSKSIKGGKISKEAIINTMKGDESLALATIMKNGGSYNLPQIVDKALIQSMNLFAKNTIQPKFKGGHFTLQSSYGIELIGETNENYTEAYENGLNPAGKNLSKNLKEKVRGLRYKHIPGKGFVAEVLVAKEFAHMTKAGDFLLPDAMGFRIPSTGLHSSVALQVVGYYDSRDSNVIIAPPELVIQHGSDFDVDSLYVLGREVIHGDTYKDLGFANESIPGYFNNSSKNALEFNKSNFLAKLAKVPDSDPRKAELEAMFYRNMIAESFISTISDINNKQVIAEPISPQSIEDAFEELGGLQANKNTDLSNPLDNMKVFNSNFQGAKLVGVFANGAKALAYMMKAGENGTYPSIPVLQPSDNRPNAAISLFGNSYSEFKEESGNYTIWQVLDALINTSVDNVKDQRLYLMNATDATGKYYIGGLSLGMPLSDLIEMMLQPVSLEVSALKGKINELPSRLLAAYNMMPVEKISTFEDLKALVSERNVSKEKAKDYRNQRLNDLKTPEAILDQVAMYVELGKLHTISEDISKFSSAIGLLQNMPINYTDISKMDKRWETMFDTDAEGNVLEDENGMVKTKSSFSFNIDNIFKSQPNIKQAHRAYIMARTTAFNSFVKHHPTLNELANRIVDENKIRISSKNSVSDLKNELFSYLLSSMYSDEVKNFPSLEYKDWANKTKTLVGKFAWSHGFAKKVDQVKAMYPDNLFLKAITINKGLGVNSLGFSQTSGKDVLETFEMQEGFDTLPREVAGLFGPNELQEGLVKYAVLNFGMRFGITNYSSYLDAQSLQRVDEYINKDVKQFLDNTTPSEVGLFMENSPMIGNFIDQLVINNPDSLPFFNKSQNRPESKGTGPNGEKLYAGYENGIWFDRKFMQKDHTTFPDYYQEGKDGSGHKVFKLINLQEGPEGTVGYYQLLGFKNRIGGYNAMPLESLAEPKLDLFSGRQLHVPSNNMNGSLQEVYDYPVNLLKGGDTVWVYPASDPTRQSGRPAKVVSSTFNPGSRKHTIQVTEMTDNEVELTKAEYKAAPLIAEMESRFGVPVKAVLAEDMPEGRQNSKGTIKDGQVYLNFSLIKTEADMNETAFHEIAHPIVAEIAKRNPKWYQNLVSELNNDRQGQLVLEAVSNNYPELSPEEQTMEAIVTMVGRLSSEHRSMGTKLKNYIKKMKDAIGSFIRNFLKTNDRDTSVEFLSDEQLADLTLMDLSAILGSKGQEFKLNLSSSMDQDWNSKRLDDIEQRLFNEGRIIFTCKA